MFYAAILALTMPKILISFLLVVGVFALGLGTIWILKKLDPKVRRGEDSAKVTGQTKTVYGDLLFVVRGLPGLFVLIVILSYAGMYIVMSMNSTFERDTMGRSAARPAYTTGTELSANSIHLRGQNVTAPNSSVSRTEDQNANASDTSAW